MGYATVTGEQAWRNLVDSAAGRWSQIAPHFDSRAFPLAASAPKLNLKQSDRFFCIGSCFARNIEEHLIYRGFDVLSMGVVSPKAEWRFRPNGFVNKFTTNSMAQEVEWVDDPPADLESLFVETPQGWYDHQLTEYIEPISLARCIERRTYLSREYFSRLRDADVVLMTLGLNEVWFDRKTGIFLNHAPNYWSVRRETGRFEMVVTDVVDNSRELERFYESVKRLNPAARFVVTVSPVPLFATFSGRDVVIANTLSKSTLRSAAEAFTDRHEDVEYFPSYEMIAHAPRSLAYVADCLHVADDAVEQVVATFLALYFGDTERVCPASFVEVNYLDKNPDVDDAVRRGEIRSGCDHWVSFGQYEGRDF